MVDFLKVLADVNALKAALAADPLDGPDIVDAGADLAHDAADVWRFFSPNQATAKAALADPANSTTVADILACCDECTAALPACVAKCSAVKAKAGAPVGAWGDGTFLLTLLQQLPGLISFLRDLFKK